LKRRRCLQKLSEGEETLEGKLGVDGRRCWIYPLSVLLVLMFIGQASAAWSDKNIDKKVIGKGPDYIFNTLEDITEMGGFKFESSQSVSGIGIVSSYKNLGPYPTLIHSQSSGSGYYGYESTILVRKDVEYRMATDEYTGSDRLVKLEEDASAAYSPTAMNFAGSFKIKPIKIMWTDSTVAGNQGGASINARFDHARALSREMSTEVSGATNYQDVIKTGSSSFAAKMKLNVNFNGTAQIGMDAGVPAEIGHNPDGGIIIYDGMDVQRMAFGDSALLMDEYYRGSFSLVKTMGISSTGRLTQSEDDLWLPCCSGGYFEMTPPDKVGHSAEGVFNCTCFKLEPGSDALT